jgi:hypothetical protein
MSTEFCPESFPSSSSPPYRYFNQPVEQVPKWDAGQNQILIHSKNSGLQWSTVQCLPVTTCVKIEANQLIAERRKIVTIADFDTIDCTVPTTDCSCCEWDGNGFVLTQYSCNNGIQFKIVPIILTKLSNYEWEYNGTLDCFGDQILHANIFCNADIDFNNTVQSCEAKWSFIVHSWPCLMPPYEPTIITESNIDTFGFPPEIIDSIRSSPTWPVPCGCDLPSYWYIPSTPTANCPCCE